MYYPYLRGKQFELILLRDNADLIADSSIHPIIEPVKKEFKPLIRAMKLLNEKNIDCTLIINPQVGEKKGQILNDLIDEEFKDYENISIGYILHAESDTAELVALLEKYNTRKFSLIHYGYSKGKEIADVTKDYSNIKINVFVDGRTGKLYQKHLKKDGVLRVLLRDGFKTQIKNSLYPPSEHFSDLHITYDDEGMDGFGDFLIVGDGYSESGGPAYAVAIHLTYLDEHEDNDMFIYHFLSVRTDSPTDPGGKFFEALEKMIQTIEARDTKIFQSNACEQYKELYDKKHYPGLGLVKKLSMQHHLELVANYINRVS